MAHSLRGSAGPAVAVAAGLVGIAAAACRRVLKQRQQLRLTNGTLLGLMCPTMYKCSTVDNDAALPVNRAQHSPLAEQAHVVCVQLSINPHTACGQIKPQLARLHLGAVLCTCPKHLPQALHVVALTACSALSLTLRCCFVSGAEQLSVMQSSCTLQLRA